MARERKSKSPPYGADHPSNVELAMVAAGALDTAKADVIATHVCGCASCRTFVRAMEHVGGFLLNSLPPTPLADGSIAGVMARLDSGINGKQATPRNPPSATLATGK
jgi:putative transcriptional regulator